MSSVHFRPRLTVTFLLFFILSVGNVRAQEPECVDSSQSFTRNEWQTSGEVVYDENLKAIILRSSSLGIPRLYKEAGHFDLDDPTKSIYLYIEYKTRITFNNTDLKFTVYPANSEDYYAYLDLVAMGDESTVQVIELAEDGVDAVGVEIKVTGLGHFDQILVSRIGIWYGNGHGTPEEIQLALEIACGWIPPVTTTPYEPQPLKKVDCIDTLEEYGTNFAWTFPAGLQNISKSESISFIPSPPAGGKDVFYLEGDGSRKTFSRLLTRDDLSDDESFFLYIKHHSYIPVPGNEKTTVNNVDNPDNFEVLNPALDSKGWAHSILKLIDDAGPFDVSILVDNYKTTDYFLIDKIAVVSGRSDGRTDEEMIEEIERVCTPDPTVPTKPTTTSSSSSSSTETTPSDDTTSTAAEEETSSSSSISPTSTSAPSPGEPVVQVISTEEDFIKYQWKSTPKYSYASTFDELPSEITTHLDLDAQGIFYIEGNDFSSQMRFEKELSESEYFDFDFSRPTFMYIRYYTFFQSSGELRYMDVLPTNPIYSLKSTGGKTWGEALVKLNLEPVEDESQSKNKIQIVIDGFREREYFLLDEIYLVNGKSFASVEAIKEFVENYLS